MALSVSVRVRVARWGSNCPRCKSAGWQLINAYLSPRASLWIRCSPRVIRYLLSDEQHAEVSSRAPWILLDVCEGLTRHSEQ